MMIFLLHENKRKKSEDSFGTFFNMKGSNLYNKQYFSRLYII